MSQLFTKQFDLAFFNNIIKDDFFEINDKVAILLRQTIPTFTAVSNTLLQSIINKFKQKLSKHKERKQQEQYIQYLTHILLGSKYYIEEWKPALIEYVSHFKETHNLLVSKCFAELNKHYKITWPIEKLKFSEREREALEQCVNPYNYFA